MGLSNSGATPPLNPVAPYSGSLPQPAPPLSAPTPLPSLPVVVRDPTAGASPESLSKRDVTVLLPQQFLSKGSEALLLLAPARVFAFLTQGGANPKEKSSPQETAKPADVKGGDETASRGNSGKGEDIVKIQVFEGEQTGDLQNKDQKSETNQSPQSATPSKENVPSKELENNPIAADLPMKEEVQGKEEKIADTTQGKNQPAVKEENAESSQKEIALPPPAAKEDASPTEKAPVMRETTPIVQTKEGEKAPLPKSSSETPASPSGAKESASAPLPKEIKEIPKPIEQVVVGKMPTSNEESIAQPSQEIVRQGAVEKPKDSPDRLTDKIRDKENVETVARDNKYQNVEHPKGHRVLESERVDYRGDAAAAQGEAHVASSLEADVLIIPWLAVFSQEQLQNEKLRRGGKGGGQKQARNDIEYRLADVLFMLLCASIGGCKTIADYILFIRAREKWFKVILGAHCQMPPKELFWRILFSLNAESFQTILTPWLEELCGKSSKLKNDEGKPVLPAISMWESPLGLLFGQSKGSAGAQDRFAIPLLLQLFNLNRVIVMAKIASQNFNVARSIEKVSAEYVVEVGYDGEAAERIDAMIDKASNSDSASYSLTESYIEGYERINIEALTLEEYSAFIRDTASPSASEVMRVSSEIIASTGNTIQKHYFIASSMTLKEEIFDLLRTQKPLENKVGWRLNCLFPAYPMEFAMQQSLTNIRLLQQFAINILLDSPGESSVKEKMQMASSNNDYMLNILSFGR